MSGIINGVTVVVQSFSLRPIVHRFSHNAVLNFSVKHYFLTRLGG